MDLVNDLFDGHIDYDDDIEHGKTKEYYTGKAEYILSNLNEENYYEFLKVICRDFKKLDEEQQKIIKEIMGIKNEIKVIEKEKIVYREKKQQKPRGYTANRHNTDDY